jgi:hypothetical protein
LILLLSLIPLFVLYFQSEYQSALRKRYVDYCQYSWLFLYLES